MLYEGFMTAHIIHHVDLLGVCTLGTYYDLPVQCDNVVLAHIRPVFLL